MIHIERTRDWELVRSIMAHPRIWPHVGDDTAGNAEDFQPNQDERILYLLALDDEEPIGLFLALPQNHVCWEMHVSILPRAWGYRAQIAVRRALEYVWNATAAARLVATIADTNPSAIAYAQRAGFQQFGYNPASFLKHGNLVGQMLLGISRPQEQTSCLQ